MSYPTWLHPFIKADLRAGSWVLKLFGASQLAAKMDTKIAEMDLAIAQGKQPKTSGGHFIISLIIVSSILFYFRKSLKKFIKKLF